MSFLSYTLLTICGISAGFVTAAAYVAFIAMLGVFPKVAQRPKPPDNVSCVKIV